MIQGQVGANLDAVISLVVRNAVHQQRTIDAVVDTGFNDYLSLPPDLISELDLPLIGEAEVILADGNRYQTTLHMVTVSWDGVDRLITVQAAEGQPLVGMALLYDCRLSIEVRLGGIVKVEPI